MPPLRAVQSDSLSDKPATLTRRLELIVRCLNCGTKLRFVGDCVLIRLTFVLINVKFR